MESPSTEEKRGRGRPKKYGEKTSMELTGANGGPVQISDTERAAKIAAILAALKK